MTKYELIIEKADSGFFGRVAIGDDLIVDEAKTIEKLEVKIKKLLSNFYDVNPNNVCFECKFDITILFDVFTYLKVSSVAELAGINSSLLRQYVTGKKHPSSKQLKKIEGAIHKISEDLSAVSVYY